MFIFDGKFASLIKKEEILKENTEEFKVQTSKLYSRKLRLQELIAKRDRITFEIKQLKKKITEDKKTGRKMQKSISEQLALDGYPLKESNSMIQDSLDKYQESYLSTKRTWEETINAIEKLYELRPLQEDETF